MPHRRALLENQPVISLRILLGVVSALTILVWTSTSLALAQEPVIVEGRVTNGTLGSGSMEGLTVTLHQESPTVHDHVEVTTDSQGRFKFENLEIDPTAIYGISARYQGALYGTDIDLSEGSPPPASINVFDSVSDQEILTGGPSSLLFAAVDKSAQTVVALEIVIIENNSDHTYVSGNDQPMNLIRFGLPPGSRNLTVDSRLIGADFVQVDRGFALLSGIPPGSYEIMFTYEFPYKASNYTFTKNYRYGAESLRILAPEEVLDISSVQLGNAESISIGERPYRIIQVSDLSRGTQVTVDILELPKASLLDKIGRSVESIRLEYAAPVGLTALMVIIVGVTLLRKKAG